MSEQQTVVVVNAGNPGMMAGIIACVLAVLGILFLGLVFVPLAATEQKNTRPVHRRDHDACRLRR